MHFKLTVIGNVHCDGQAYTRTHHHHGQSTTLLLGLPTLPEILPWWRLPILLR